MQAVHPAEPGELEADGLARGVVERAGQRAALVKGDRDVALGCDRRDLVESARRLLAQLESRGGEGAK